MIINVIEKYHSIINMKMIVKKIPLRKTEKPSWMTSYFSSWRRQSWCLLSASDAPWPAGETSSPSGLCRDTSPPDSSLSLTSPAGHPRQGTRSWSAHPSHTGCPHRACHRAGSPGFEFRAFRCDFSSQK